jgi:hypothetical protein
MGAAPSHARTHDIQVRCCFSGGARWDLDLGGMCAGRGLLRLLLLAPRPRRGASEVVAGAGFLAPIGVETVEGRGGSTALVLVRGFLDVNRRPWVREVSLRM